MRKGGIARMNFEEMFEGFFNKYPRYNKYKISAVKEILLKTVGPQSIAEMIKYADMNKPAIFGVLETLEELASRLEFDFTLKQLCGAWIAYTLKDFGYLPTKQKPVSKSKYFFSAACYEKTGEAIKELIITYSIRNIE
jgi:hypothetical protein